MSDTPKTRLDESGYGDYTDSSQEHSFRSEGGLVAMPLAQREPGHKIIRIHGGIGYRTVAWRYARSGKPPIIPAAVDTTGDTLLNTVVSPLLPVPNPIASGYDWVVSGTYEYVQDVPRQAGYDTFPVGSHPYPVLPQDNLARAYVRNHLQDYFDALDDGDPATNPFDVLYTAVSHDLTFAGTFSWPFRALPPVFSSDHMIGD